MWGKNKNKELEAEVLRLRKRVNELESKDISNINIMEYQRKKIEALRQNLKGQHTHYAKELEKLRQQKSPSEEYVKHLEQVIRELK